jgi:site-specific recombinase XerD
MPTTAPIPVPKEDAWERWIERFLDRLEARRYSQSSLSSRRRHLRAFARYALEIGVRGPEGIGTGLVRAYLLYRREAPNSTGKKDSPKTSNLHFMALKRFLEFLSLEGLIAEKLVRAVEYIKVPYSLPKDIPSDAEVKRLLATADTSRTTGFRDRTVIEFMYSTALRRQELSDLKLCDVDFTERFVRVECGKGGKGGVVPLGRVAGQWLRAYILAVRPELLRSKSDPGWMFLTKSGNKMGGSEILDIVVRACRRAGIDKKITPHALRRACATEMIRRGANIYHVKEMLRHKELDTMDRYVRLLIVDLKEAHRKFHPREQEPDPVRLAGEGGNEGNPGPEGGPAGTKDIDGGDDGTAS